MANNVTFMISALWHGFYPGYFIAFFHWSLLAIASKYCYKASFKFANFNFDNPIYKLSKFLIFKILMSYFGSFFMLLSFELSWKLIVSTYFIPPLLLYSVIIFFMLTGNLLLLLNLKFF